MRSCRLPVFFVQHYGLFHQYAAREAEIVAQAGRKYAVTISTNMAGRGTDIILGGNPKVCDALITSFISDLFLWHLHASYHCFF